MFVGYSRPNHYAPTTLWRTACDDDVIILLPERHHTLQNDSSLKRTFCHRAEVQRMYFLTKAGHWHRWAGVRSYPRRVWPARRLAPSVDWIDRLSPLQLLRLVWGDPGDGDSRYIGSDRGHHIRSLGMWATCCQAKLFNSTPKTAYCPGVDIKSPHEGPDGHSTKRYANGAFPKPCDSCGILKIAISGLFKVAFYRI